MAAMMAIETMMLHLLLCSSSRLIRQRWEYGNRFRDSRMSNILLYKLTFQANSKYNRHTIQRNLATEEKNNVC
jgi:hypothetical protein